MSYNWADMDGEDDDGDEEEGMSDEKLYTAADREQAREQGAEDERARCLAEIELLNKHRIRKVNKSYLQAILDCQQSIRALGPIGETREETEEQVFVVLERYGIPRNRAGSIANGIEVLVARLNKARIADCEETERRVRRETVEQIKRIAPYFEDENDRAVIFDISVEKLDAIAEGKS